MTSWSEAQRLLLEHIVVTASRSDSTSTWNIRGEELSPVAREDGTPGVRLFRPDSAVAVEVYPSSDGTWNLRSWILEPTDDYETVMLGLEVLAVTSPPTREWTEPREWAAYDFHSTFTAVLASDAEFDKAAESTVVTLSLAALDERKRTTAEYLARRIPGLILGNYGGILPIQAEGTWHGYPFYFRFRYSPATLSIGVDDPVGDPFWNAWIDVPEEWFGSMTDAQFIDTFIALASRLERTLPAVEFSTSLNTDSVRDTWRGRGNTVEEAYADAVRRCNEVYAHRAVGLPTPVTPAIDPTPVTPFVPRAWPEVDFVVLPDTP